MSTLLTWNWEFALGLWGAMLSSWLGIRELRKGRPTYVVSPVRDGPDGTFFLRVLNSHDLPILVRKIGKLGGPVVVTVQASSVRDTIRALINEADLGNLDLSIPGHGAANFLIAFNEGPKFAILIVKWSGQDWLPGWPRLIVLYPSRLRALQRSFEVNEFGGA